MTTQVKTKTLMLAVTLALAVTGAKEQLRERMQGADGQRGALSLEWAIIGAIVVALAAVVAIKITAAVDTYVAQIK